MTINKEQLEALYKEIACGSEYAYEWLLIWQNLAHKIDDIIDGDITDPTQIVKAFLECENLYSHPFYTEFKHRLYPVIFCAATAYADSIRLKDSLPAVADIIRSNNDVLIIVAGICAPLGVDTWEHVQNISIKIRKLSYDSQH